MATSVNRDVRFQAIVHAGRVIEPHGEGASPVITFDAFGEVARGARTDIHQTSPNVGGTLVYSMRREEKAYRQLKEIVLEQLNLVPRPKAPGLTKDSSNTGTVEVVTWEDSYCTQFPDFSMGRTSDIVTFTFSLSGASIK